MEREQLFQNLSELQKQLQGIRSATEHVNQVVAADRQLVAAVEAYTAEAKKMLDSARNVYDGDVEQVKRAAVAALDKSANDFSAKVTGITAELTSNVSMLRQTVDESIRPMVDETVGVIENTLKPFVKDEMPRTFKEFLDKYEKAFAKSAASISKASKDFSSSVETGAGLLGNTAGELQQKADGLMSAANAVNKAVGDIDGRLDSLSGSINVAKKDIKDTVSDNAKAITEYIASSDTMTRSALAGLTDKLAALASQLETVADKVKEMDAIGSKVKSIDTRVINLGGAISGMKEANEKTRADIQSLRGMVMASLFLGIITASGILILLLTKFIL